MWPPMKVGGLFFCRNSLSLLLRRFPQTAAPSRCGSTSLSHNKSETNIVSLQRIVRATSFMHLNKAATSDEAVAMHDARSAETQKQSQRTTARGELLRK